MSADLGAPMFNLVDEPWLRVQMTDGTTTEVGLAEAFADAEVIERVAGESPTQDFAVLRLLLAVLRRATGWPGDPEADDDVQRWAELWADPVLPAEVGQYLEAMRDRFWLFGGPRPFYQVPDLQYAKAGRGPDPMAGIVPEIPAGRAWFQQRGPRECAVLPAAEAARWLVHLQAFDVAGIKSGTAGDPRVKGGKSYPIGTGWAGALGGVFVQGSTLRETLLLNLAPGQAAVALEDLPAWERGLAEAGAPDREPTGPIDVLTWQSRRVRLVPDTGGQHSQGMVLTNGERLTVPNRHTVEYLSQWRRSDTQAKKLRMPLVIMPRRHDPARAIWRGLPAILGAVADGGPPPGCVAGVELLTGRGVLAVDFPIRVVAAGLGYGSNDSVIADAYHDTLDFVVGAIRDPAHVQLVARAADAADQAASAVGRFGQELHFSAGGHRDQARAVGDRARGRCLAVFDPLFRQWASGLRPDAGTDAEADWQRAVRDSALEVVSELLAEAPDRAWLGTPEGGVAGDGRWRSAPAAEARVRVDLLKDLPLAHTEEEK